MDDNRFEHDSLQDSEKIAHYLNALAEGFSKGALQLRNNEGAIDLQPRGLIRFGIKATERPDRLGFDLSFTWRPPVSDDDDTGPLLINGHSDD